MELVKISFSPFRWHFAFFPAHNYVRKAINCH